MSTESKSYNAEKNVWVDAYGHEYLKNEFDPGTPVWLNISSPLWVASWQGSVYELDWSSIDLSDNIKTNFKEYLVHILKKQCVRLLAPFRILLSELSALIDPKHVDMGTIEISEWLEIWQALSIGARKVDLRRAYKYLAQNNIGGAQIDIYYEMNEWVAVGKRDPLIDVLQWHETRGALTREEEQVLRKALENPPESETAVDFAIRLIIWLLLMTIKRPSQILGIEKDGLKKINNRWFVLVPGVKAQTGRKKKWCPIPEALALEILKFSKIEEVKKLQDKYNLLILFDGQNLHDMCHIPGYDLSNNIRRYIKQRGLISPRTNEPMHISPTRLRHTGATLLAFQGVSRDIIQEILEHDHPRSAQAYIDAISTEIGKAINRADRNLGGIFSQLNKAFLGTITNEVKKQPIVVPICAKTPLIVGDCGKNTVKDGPCEKHPFLDCYDECHRFEAWRKGKHAKALQYVNAEEKKLREFYNNDYNEQIMKLGRVRTAILQVMTDIDRGQS